MSMFRRRAPIGDIPQLVTRTPPQPLPPYKSTPKCIKCGVPTLLTARTTYRPHHYAADLPEHLERTCTICNYIWREACADQTPTNPGEPTA